MIVIIKSAEVTMETALVPVPIRQLADVVLFGMGIFLVGAHTWIAATAAARSSLSRRAAAIVPLAVAGYLALWLAVGIVTGSTSTGAPLDLGRRLASSALTGFGPALLAVLLVFSTSTLRALNDATAPAALIRLQSYRMAGLMFLYPFMVYGVVPPGFAWPAALGDFATGLMAPFVAKMVAERRPHATAWAIAWNAFGILDLLVAPASAILSHAQVLNIFPLALVPLFVGPPMGILTHVLSLRNLSATTRTETRVGPEARLGIA
jgi:hypothetical protein